MRRLKYGIFAVDGSPLISGETGGPFKGTLDEAFAAWEKYNLIGWRIRPI